MKRVHTFVWACPFCRLQRPRAPGCPAYRPRNAHRLSQPAGLPAGLFWLDWENKVSLCPETSSIAVDAAHIVDPIVTHPQPSARRSGAYASRITNTLINKSPNPISPAAPDRHQLERHAGLSGTCRAEGRGCLTFCQRPFEALPCPIVTARVRPKLPRMVVSSPDDNFVTTKGSWNCAAGDVIPSGRSVLQPTVRFGPNQVMPSRPDPRMASAPSQHAWPATGPHCARDNNFFSLVSPVVFFFFFFTFPLRRCLVCLSVA